MDADVKETTVEDLFEQWHQTWEPEAGYITLKLAVQQYTAVGLSTPLPAVLTRGDVTVIGRHKHGPGGQMPPWFMEDGSGWTVRLDSNRARELRFSDHIKSWVQVQVHKAQFEQALEAALAEERGDPPPAVGEVDHHNEPVGAPNPGLLQRPTPAAKKHAVACRLCAATNELPHPDAIPHRWLHLGHRKDLGEGIFICGECREYINAQ